MVMGSGRPVISGRTAQSYPSIWPSQSRSRVGQGAALLRRQHALVEVAVPVQSAAFHRVDRGIELAGVGGACSAGGARLPRCEVSLLLFALNFTQAVTQDLLER
jgi:hypothetical protein